jgi:hypothetical protein
MIYTIKRLFGGLSASHQTNNDGVKPMQKEITLDEFADELTIRLNKGKTVDCCKEELLRLAVILKEKLPDEKILVNWKEDF